MVQVLKEIRCVTAFNNYNYILVVNAVVAFEGVTTVSIAEMFSVMQSLKIWNDQTLRRTEGIAYLSSFSMKHTFMGSELPQFR